MRKFGSFFTKTEPIENEPINKKETKIFAEIEIGYKQNTNVLNCDLDHFSLVSIEDIYITEPIRESKDINVIDGFSDPISQQILRFPNENKHAIILFICDKELLGDKTDYILNKRKDSYYIVKYAGDKCNLIYVDSTGEELNVTSIRYKAKHIIIYSHQCLVGCCNDVPLFYFKNKGKLKIIFNVKNELVGKNL